MIAIGDIHGQYKALVKLLSILPKDEQLIFLGDYCDRGEDSFKVIELLIQLQLENPSYVFLKGNHDEFLLGASDAIVFDVRTLMYNGGDKTHESYYKESVLYGLSDEGNEFKIPEHHYCFLKNLPISHETDKFFFVHAGVDPRKDNPFTETYIQDYMWIREPFLHSDRVYDKVIVHGHSVTRPTFTIDIKHNRINVDTGAGYNKKLSAINPETHESWQVDVSTLEVN